jgi:hypothetical protein
MFVRLSKYRKIVAKAATLTDQVTSLAALAKRYNDLAYKWHSLATDQKKQIEQMEVELLWHKKQAEQLAAEVHLARMSNAKAAAPQFTQEQIRTLITLCHPDKHDGKESAKTMTQQLLQMRK